MDAIGGNGAMIATLLDAAARRQRVLAANIANVDTPGYKAKTLEFPAELEKAMLDGSVPEGAVKGLETVERDTPMKANGNTVDVDLELAEMGKTSMAFQTLLVVSQMKQAQMRAAITGRG